MDDDGSKSLSYDEFKKGLHDYGMSVTDSVRNNNNKLIPNTLSVSLSSLSGIKDNVSDV